MSPLLPLLCRPVLRAVWRLGPFPCPPTMLRPLGFQAHLWPDVSVTGAPQGAPCRQQGAGDRVPKPPPPPWHSILGVPGPRPPLASLWFGGLNRGFPSLSPGEESLHIPQGWPLRTATCLAMRVVHFFVPLPHPPFSIAVLPHSWVLGAGALQPSSWWKLCGERSQVLAGPRTSASETGRLQPPVPRLTSCRNLWGPAREHGVVPSVGLGRSRDPRQMSQEWNPAVPTWGFCGTQKGKRKGTEGCICFSRGSSLIVEA